MPVIKIVDFNGQDAGEITLSDAVFSVPLHVPAMHQVVVAHLANCRQGTHSVKTRGEVSGGGKKPWKQKHTGRARQGSTRSPIWIHGGVAHGPHPRDYHQKVNKKVRRLAMLSALSMKVREEMFTVVKGFDLDKPSTKAMKNFMNTINAQKALVIYHADGNNLVRSARNIPGTRVINVASINVYDLLNSETLVVTPEVVARLEEAYAK
ncbi:MAG: 50S ribosomal protein L4 [Synergistaceae bacterium]|jgi:large subunit ribosomal protein L4|nr:50S ribosomal protein L4 [Synergistaceae bacterium]